MIAIQALLNSIHEDTHSHSRRPEPLHSLSRWHVLNCMTACVMLLLFLAFPVPAEAGMVYGRIHGAKAELQPEDTLVFKDKKGNQYRAKVDKYKGYSIVLPEGLYGVEFEKHGTLWAGSIQSFPDTVRQDIYLKKQIKE